MTLLGKRKADDLHAKPPLLRGLALPSNPHVPVVHLWTLLGVPWDPRAGLPRTQRPGAQAAGLSPRSLHSRLCAQLWQEMNWPGFAVKWSVFSHCPSTQGQDHHGSIAKQVT